MAKYKVGDKVRIVSERPCDSSFTLDMRRFLGEEITISMVREFNGIPYYYSEDAKPKNPVQESFCKILGVPGYYFRDEWISGLAEPEKPADENLSVTIRFCGRMTVAELYKNGKVVKVENARCNPKDTYSRGEGARVAVERLFEKKRKEDKTKESKPKIGDKFVIVGKSHYHGFSIGETVRLIRICEQGKRYENCRGLGQWVCDSDVKPYKEKAK